MATEALEIRADLGNGADRDTACLTSVKLVISNPKALFKRCF